MDQRMESYRHLMSRHGGGLGLFSSNDSSSAPSPFRKMEIPGTPSNSTGTPNSKQAVPSSTGLPWLRSAIVKRDHDSFGSTTAFFKEIMRRDAIIGVRTVLALCGAS